MQGRRSFLAHCALWAGLMLGSPDGTTHEEKGEEHMAFEQWEEVAAHSLEQGESVTSLVERLPNIVKVFEPTDGLVRCIDEGTPGGIHLAGSGVLFDNDDELVELLRRSGAKGLTSHAGCGAAALYAKNRNLGPVDTDIAGARRIRAIAEKAGIPYAGHIEKLQRPSHHNAFAVYYDSTGLLNPTNSVGLPPGFIVSRSLHRSPAMPLMEAMIGAQIAFGEHGWGSHFTAKTPFLIIPVASPEYSLEGLVEELQSIQEKYRDLVRIDGFDATKYLDRVRV